MVFKWTEATIEFGYKWAESQQELHVVGEGRQTKANAITSESQASRLVGGSMQHNTLNPAQVELERLT